MIGIVSWGSYIPRYRIKINDIARAQGDFSYDSNNEKSLPGIDEDSATMAVEAARIALLAAQLKSLDAIYIGSESHPYAVKPTSTIVGEALNIGNNYTAADLQFACKAGTAGMQIAYAMVRAGIARFALAGGTDTAQSAPGDQLEFTAAAGAAMFIIGTDPIAKINETVSFSSDTPDFWRKKHERYPQHSGVFTGEPSYFKHVIAATKELMARCGSKPEDYDHVIFHQPNEKFPIRVAKKLGFTDIQIKQGMLVHMIGNTYSACSLLGLASVLDIARPGERILLTSYGSGAGSDSFDMTITKKITEFQTRIKKVKSLIDDKIMIDYLTYLKNTGKLR